MNPVAQTTVLMPASWRASSRVGARRNEGSVAGTAARAAASCPCGPMNLSMRFSRLASLMSAAAVVATRSSANLATPSRDVEQPANDAHAPVGEAGQVECHAAANRRPVAARVARARWTDRIPDPRSRRTVPCDRATRARRGPGSREAFGCGDRPQSSRAGRIGGSRPRAGFRWPTRPPPARRPSGRSEGRR